jgi:hypothetical protein
MLHVMKALVGLFFDIGFPVAIGQHPEDIASSPTASETGFTWVEPVADEQIVGELKDLAALNNVKAAQTNGYWYTSPTNIGTVESASPDEKVIMHLHSTLPNFNCTCIV